MHKQILTSVVVLPFLFACFQDDPTGDDGGTETAGDGDGDPTGDGDGDGDPTGDGDGDDPTTTGDGDGDQTGDGDGDQTGDGDGDQTGDGDGEPAAECGNGVIEGDEVCDDGVDNALEPGACAPNCSTIIESKALAMGNTLDGAGFQPNPVVYADSRCEPGYKAMFVFGNTRVATTVPWQSVNSVDWPIKPYTAYFRGPDLVWVTDDVAMLAIRDGAHQAPINPFFVCDGFCLNWTLISGLAKDGTTSPSGTCDGWTTTSDNVNMNIDNKASLEYDVSSVSCSSFGTLTQPRFLCVEQ